MKKLSISLITLLFLVSFSSCDDILNSDDEPVEFHTAPSDELSTKINGTPSDFTWDYSDDHVQVSAESEGDWSGEIVLSLFHVDGNEVVNRATTGAYQTNIDELSEGLSTEAMIPGTRWASGKTWVQGIRGSLIGSNRFIQQRDPLVFAPSEVENEVINIIDLEPNQTMLVVYTHIPGETDMEVNTQPFGIIFEQED